MAAGYSSILLMTLDLIMGMIIFSNAALRYDLTYSMWVSFDSLLFFSLQMF